MDEARIQIYTDVSNASALCDVDTNNAAVVDLNLVYNMFHLQSAAAAAWAALANGTAKTKTFQTEMCYRLAYSKNINETQRLYMPKNTTSTIAVITKQNAPVDAITVQGTPRDASYFDEVTNDAKIATMIDAFRLNATEVTSSSLEDSILMRLGVKDTM